MSVNETRDTLCLALNDQEHECGAVLLILPGAPAEGAALGEATHGEVACAAGSGRFTNSLGVAESHARVSPGAGRRLVADSVQSGAHQLFVLPSGSVTNACPSSCCHLPSTMNLYWWYLANAAARQRQRLSVRPHCPGFGCDSRTGTTRSDGDSKPGGTRTAH